MTELRECPFCGAPVSFHFSNFLGGGIHMIDCYNCGTMVSFCKPGEDEPSREQVTERWNTRYEPTCRMDKNDAGSIICSNCGREMDFYDCGCGVGEHVYERRHCFNCGARVVDGDAS